MIVKLERRTRSSFVAQARPLYSVMRNAIIPALLFSALASAPAAAQTITPFFGGTFGGDTTENSHSEGAVQAGQRMAREIVAMKAQLVPALAATR